MAQSKKGSTPSKEAPTRAEHLRQSKGASLPKRVEGKPAGAAIAGQPERKGKA